ncbi:MAG TPA: tryptophan synthase subunit alpha [Actinomycetota bacterium]|nr:tryptophan synthase subunit alpha [Actinomycetota bacterium]
MTGDLEVALRKRRDAGGRAFVPYVTGGLDGVDADLLRDLAAAGADAIEVGIPFSDPVMDGGVIQEASRRALEAGTRPEDVLRTIHRASVDVPVAVMTYFNPVLRHGVSAFLDDAANAGVAGIIVPDLPVDEAHDVAAVCKSAGVAPVFLAAPGTSPKRLHAIAGVAAGFVYCVSTYGVTGEREALSGTAARVVEALRPLTDLPLLIGVGIGTPEQAAEACRFADGVVVGSALVRPLLEGDRDAAIRLAGAFRDAVPS